MKVEISKEELEDLEVSINAAIKFSALMMSAAVMDKNSPVKVDDILRANIYLKNSLDFVRRVKKEADNGRD